LEEAYNQLNWAQDSGWGQLRDYVFEDTSKKPETSVPLWA